MTDERTHDELRGCNNDITSGVFEMDQAALRAKLVSQAADNHEWDAMRRDRDAFEAQYKQAKSDAETLADDLERCMIKRDKLRASHDSVINRNAELIKERDKANHAAKCARRERDCANERACGRDDAVAQLESELRTVTKSRTSYVDALRDLVAESAELTAKINVKIADKVQLRKERDTAIADRDAYRAELEAQLKRIDEQDKLLAHSDVMSGRDTDEYIKLKKAYDVAVMDKNHYHSLYDGANHVRGELKKERDGLVDDLKKMTDRAHRAASQRDTFRATLSNMAEAWQERDAKMRDMVGAETQRQNVVAEMEKLAAEFRKVVHERDDIMAHAWKMQCERDGIMAERDAALAERDTYRAAAETFERQRDQARQSRDINKSYAEECRTLRAKVTDLNDRMRYVEASRADHKNHIAKLRKEAHELAMEIAVYRDVMAGHGIIVVDTRIEKDGDNNGDE
jgi:chromosome segregation ATPase